MVSDGHEHPQICCRIRDQLDKSVLPRAGRVLEPPTRQAASWRYALCLRSTFDLPRATNAKGASPRGPIANLEEHA
jgi:hypothetical protein